MKTIHEFEIKIEKEIEKIESREENGQTITTKKNVKEPVVHRIAFKRPSRSEREEADEYRAACWSKYVEKGILPEALLLKTYANYGGILSNEQKEYYNKTQANLLLALEDLQAARINEKDNDAKHEELALKVTRLRDEVIGFQKEQAVFFDNTAEARARNKLIEYLILNLSYYKADAENDWKPIFNGKSLEEKQNHAEKMEEDENEMYILCRDKLSFIAALYVSANGLITSEEITAFEEQSI